MQRRHRGHGFLIAAVGVALVTLGGVFATQAYGLWVLGETEDFALGARALMAARASLGETLLAFRAHANRPGSTWWTTLRVHLTTREGLAWWLVAQCSPRLTREALAGEPAIHVDDVRASVWRDEAADPAARTLARQDGAVYEDQAALITLTAKVTAGDRRFGFLGPRVCRQVQRTYTLKQDRIVPPEAFAPDTLYVDSLPLLVTEREAYDALIRSIRERRQVLQARYEEELRMVAGTLERYLSWMRAKVKDLDDTEALIRRTASKLEETKGEVPLTLGLAEPAVVQLQKTLDGLKKGLAEDLARTLTAFDLPDEETFRRVAANPYPPGRLIADARFRLSAGTWPSFRGHVASDDGCSAEGPDLTLPVVVLAAGVRTTQVEIHLPPPPSLPARPTYSLASSAIDWLGRYDRIASEFRRYNAEYDRSLAGFQEAARVEYARHEGLFHLLPARPPEVVTLLASLRYQGRRAARFYPSQAEFAKDAVSGGVLELDGVVAVKSGGTTLSGLPATYRGRGVIVTDGDVSIDAIRAAEPGSTLTVVSAGVIRVRGECEAALATPAQGGRVIATGNPGIHGMVIVSRLAREDDFTVRRDAAYGDRTGAAQWITVATAPLAEALLRE